MGALMVATIAPVLIISLVLTQDPVEQIVPAENAATIDVTDIDQNGTVMYTVSPTDADVGFPNTDFTIPQSVLHDADILKITIQDDEDLGKWLGDGSEVDCSFTLHLSDDDAFDNQSESFTGYIRVSDDYLDAQSDAWDSEECGFYLSLDFEE